jgi:excisionase family DNA binding protein
MGGLMLAISYCYSSIMKDPGEVPVGEVSVGASPLKTQFLTVAEVARLLRVSNMTVYRLVKANQLAAVRVGRGYRIREEDVRKYLEQRYMDAG